MQVVPGDERQLAVPFSDVVETVGADDAHGEEVVGGLEAARGDIAFVLDGAVAAGWWEVCGQFCQRVIPGASFGGGAAPCTMVESRGCFRRCLLRRGGG